MTVPYCKRTKVRYKRNAVFTTIRTIEQAENLAKLKESISPRLSGIVNIKEITDEIMKQLD